MYMAKRSDIQHSLQRLYIKYNLNNLRSVTIVNAYPSNY